MKVIISVDANKPVCDTTAATPPVSGYVSQGNLNLDAGCRYNLYEASHATNCLQGSWIMMTGSSNTLLELLARWLRIFFLAHWSCVQPGAVGLSSSAPGPELLSNVHENQVTSIRNAFCAYVFNKKVSGRGIPHQMIQLTAKIWTIGLELFNLGDPASTARFGNLINFLAPDEYTIERDGEMIGASAVADVVIEKLAEKHMAYVLWCFMFIRWSTCSHLFSMSIDVF